MNLHKFNRLLREGRNGNVDSIAELTEYVESLATTTNRKMRALEKANYDFYGYDRPAAALEILDRKRFRQKWNVDTAIENWREFEETARATYIFINRNQHTTPKDVQKYSEKRLNYLLDILEKSDTRGMSETAVQNLNNSIENVRKEIGTNSETVKQMERAIASGAISNLFSMQYGITGEAFEALYSAFENGAEFTREIADKIQELTKGMQKIGGTTSEDLLEYIRSLGE